MDLSNMGENLALLNNGSNVFKTWGTSTEHRHDGLDVRSADRQMRKLIDGEIRRERAGGVRRPGCVPPYVGGKEIAIDTRSVMDSSAIRPSA
jgi:hypothetical protein